MDALTPIKNVKIVCDPLWGLIDITDYLPMIDVPEFQALGFKYQLGVTSLIYPSATHTRKQHSFGAMRRTQDLAHRWIERGFITKDEAQMLIAFALWHDIGHGPFSHVVEEVTRERYGRDHKQNCVMIVERLRNVVEEVGIDFAEFRKFFTHENPLHLAVSDKNLGTEKLDYLARDAYFTLGEIPGIEYVAHHTYFIDGKLMIDEKAIDPAKSVQEFYVKMYKTVYLRKNSLIAQRLMQKMTAGLLDHTKLAEKEFWALTDFGLLGLMEVSEDRTVRDLYRRFMHRQLPKTAIMLRPDRFNTMEGGMGKAQISLGVTDQVMERLSTSKHFASPSRIEAVERAIEKTANLPALSVVVVPPAFSERFSPTDILIRTASAHTARLSDYFPNHFKAIEEEGESYAVLRVCAFEEYRKALSEPKLAHAIREYLISLA